MTRQWWAGDPERHRLAEQVEHLAPGAVMVRVRPDGTVTCYRPDRTEIPDRNPAHDQRIAELLRGYYQAVNWRLPHDFYPDDMRLCAAPQPGQNGANPVADRTFGSAPGPTRLTGTPVIGVMPS